jgi:hypothetical protein
VSGWVILAVGAGLLVGVGTPLFVEWWRDKSRTATTTISVSSPLGFSKGSRIIFMDKRWRILKIRGETFYVRPSRWWMP